MENSQYFYREGSSLKMVWANGKEGQGGGSESTIQAVDVTVLLHATGGSVLEGISSDVVRRLSPFFKHVYKRFS
jgi:hypothetical protein